MTSNKRIKDSILTGLIAGSVSLFIFYELFEFIRKKLMEYFDNPYIMKPHMVQLMAMLVNVIMFRIIMLNWKKENTAKGFLLITVVSTLIYFFTQYRIKE